MTKGMAKAMFWSRVKNGKDVGCELCPRNCIIPDGKAGFCKVRKNIDGTLYALTFGRPVSISVDPIEKKPLYHFLPGTDILSVATYGCNLACKHCQNFSISREFLESDIERCKEVSPEELVKLAGSAIAWTYTEPTVFYEYFYETAKLAKKRGIRQVWVTNGYTSIKAIKKANGLIDAVNVDWKGNDKFYKDITLAPGALEHIKKSLLQYKKQGVWIEITNLLIPELNDSEKDVKEMCIWIKKNLGDVPLHFSAYYPSYKMSKPPTPLKTIENAVRIADNYLSYVYAGNVFHKRNNTFCPKCGELLIKRVGNSVIENKIIVKRGRGSCPKCGKVIAGVFS